MKKLLSIFLSFMLVLVLAGCSISFDLGGDDDDDGAFQPDVDVTDDDADDDVADDADDDVADDDADDDVADDADDDVADDADDDVADDDADDDAYTGENYVTLKSPNNGTTYYEEPIVFEGVVSPNTTKIIVTAQNGDPDGMMPVYDVYTLQDFDYGDSSFIYRAKVEWDNLFPGTNEYEFEAYYDDGTKETAYITIYYSPSVAEIAKPVVYLYPEETMEVYVDVEPDGGVSVSEPALNDGWNVVATPDSRLYNFSDGKVYPYLFWEGYSSTFDSPEEGFVVKADDLDGFFSEKLAVLGLNDTEIADFEEFWLPVLSEDPYYFITFIPQEDFDSYAPLIVSPAPDSVIRVIFDYKGLSEHTEVTEQLLSTPEREGFSVVEWGGRIYR